MEVNWAWGKIRITMTEQEADALLTQARIQDNQFLQFLFRQISLRLTGPR